MTSPHQAPRPSATPDIRLVVTDLDGTLLDAAGRLPDAFGATLAELNRRGIVFSPASGRQYATIAGLFAGADDGMVHIAENGAYVVRDGLEVSSAPLEPAVAARIVRSVRQLTDEGADVGVVVCGKRAASIERTDAAFVAEVAKYYAARRTVTDLTAVDDDVVKVAVFAFGDAAGTVAPVLKPLEATHQVVVSGAHWIDVMQPGVNKGTAVRRLQRELGVTPAQTMAFGDYLNDLEMLDAAEWSFAMAGAHPDVIRRARQVCPAHTENGVLRTLARVLDLPPVA
ncbi:Cof-type HAD-IIB family hydrolase [Streptomyces avicenniae]|uniref:Cof-type HAD-IIB family hydrolase n=1 Tax=Streptomyces avicenniae TaxID=500153 RepID=UPI00069B1F71|nr:Cof-type HAD-IIB family hydrolase [Streptomyces avicenniae]